MLKGTCELVLHYPIPCTGQAGPGKFQSKKRRQPFCDLQILFIDRGGLDGEGLYYSFVHVLGGYGANGQVKSARKGEFN